MCNERKGTPTIEYINNFMQEKDIKVNPVRLGDDPFKIMLEILEYQQNEIEDLKHEIKTLT